MLLLTIMSLESTSSNSQQNSTSQSTGHLVGGQSSDHNLIAELWRIESSLSLSIRSVSDHVDRLSEMVYGPTMCKGPTESAQVLWADCRDGAP